MGLEDEAYALALEEMRRKDLVEKLKLAQTQQALQIQQATQYPTNLGTPVSKIHGHIGMKSKDLDHEAAKVSLDVLKNMWIVRWQDKWVGRDELMDDDFWRIAFVRLENVNKMERHMLADNMQYVYRIIE